MSYEEILATSDDGRYRVKLVADEYPDEPDNDGQSPLLRFDRSRAEHVMATGRPTDNDTQIEEAAQRWGSPSSSDFPLFEKYLRVFHGVTQIETWYSGSYWYVTYDSAAWREYTGAPAGSANLDEWKAYCEGDVWGYVVERNVTWHRDDNPGESMETWENEDSCWGYYGDDYVRKSAMSAYQYVLTSSERLAAAVADIERVSKLPPIT